MAKANPLFLQLDGGGVDPEGIRTLELYVVQTFGMFVKLENGFQGYHDRPNRVARYDCKSQDLDPEVVDEIAYLKAEIGVLIAHAARGNPWNDTVAQTDVHRLFSGEMEDEELLTLLSAAKHMETANSK